MRQLLPLALALFTTGCATLFNRGSEPISLRSDPPGAIVAMDGLDVGPTPQVVRMSIRNTARFDFRWSDGATASCTVESSIAPKWYLFDVFTGLLGLAVDVVDGDAVTIDRHECAVRHPGAVS